MRFTFFHLMPYRPMDMEQRHQHRAAWVVLPNTLYDPKKGAEEYRSYIDQLAYAAPWPWAKNLFRVQRETVQPRLEEAVLTQKSARTTLDEARKAASAP